MTALLLQDFKSELIGEPPARPALGNSHEHPPPVAPPFDPTTHGAGPDQADDQAEEIELLAAAVEELAAAVEATAALIEAGDAELAAVEEQHRALGDALVDHRRREAEALELLCWAEGAGELAGERFPLLVANSLAAGREPGAWIRLVARWCRREQRRGRPVRPPLVGKILRARARELLAAGVECAR
jgi:hypothetical protein